MLGTHSVHYSFVPLCAISKMIRVFIRVEIVMVKSFECSNLKPDSFLPPFACKEIKKKEDEGQGDMNLEVKAIL